MRQFLALSLATVALMATAPSALGHGERIEYICAKADGDHLFLTANHQAAAGLSKNLTQLATSATLPIRPIGIIFTICCGWASLNSERISV